MGTLDHVIVQPPTVTRAHSAPYFFLRSWGGRRVTNKIGTVRGTEPLHRKETSTDGHVRSWCHRASARVVAAMRLNFHSPSCI